MASPVLRPMRIFRGGSLRSAKRRLSSASLACWRKAARQARSAWSSWSRGAPQRAMMASPSNLSTVPSSSRMISVMAER